MRPFASLSRRGHLGRLRRLGRAALTHYPGHLERGSLTLLRHEQNTTFRVEDGVSGYVLRVSRPDLHTGATIRSEMAWLAALRRDAELPVPEPVATIDGSFVIVATDPG